MARVGTPSHRLPRVLAHLLLGAMLAAPAGGVGHAEGADMAPPSPVPDPPAILGAADARPYTLLGSILIFRDHFREAAETLERAVELAPADPYVLVNLAEVYLDGLRIDDALPLLERLFALDPNRESAAANRGRQILAAAHARLAEGG